MNILLLSSIYPIPGPHNQGTKVCHFFAKEWVAMGHRVVAVHFQATYPGPFYWVARLFQKKLMAKTGAIVYAKKEKEPVCFEMDGVEALRIPLYKPIPHGRFPKKRIRGAVKIIDAFIRRKEFIPDVIVGHFLNPQLEVLNLLKAVYKNAKTGLVFHLPAEIDMAEGLYKEDLPILYKGIDIIGFRNEPLRQYFEKVSQLNHKSFICYSGIPGTYVTRINHHTFNSPLTNFIYVGGLIERKFPIKILDALHDVYPNGGFKMKYVGCGSQKEAIEDKIQKYNMQGAVSLHGKIERDRILPLYDWADFMIMISKGEAYGLVYLEAMSRGCITIASRDEGMDGIIRDGFNGFLCRAGDAVELASILKHINSLSQEEIIAISANAIRTASDLTDKLVAEKYLNDVIS